MKIVEKKAANVESSKESCDECSDNENFNLLTKRFQKFIR